MSLSRRNISLQWFFACLVCLLSCHHVRLVAAAADVEHPNVTLTKLAFGSCHKRKYVQDTTRTIWNAIANARPDSFLWTGDTVYPPMRRVASVDDLNVEYKQMLYNATLGYTHLDPPHGMYGTWDDHDYGGNDWGIDMPDKEKRRDAYMDFIFSKNTRKPDFYSERKGVYQSVEWGQPPHKVKAILLDTRWHRESHCIPSIATSVPMGAAMSCLTRWASAGLNLPKYLPRLCRNHKTPSLLGQDQWAWLEHELENSNAQVHVVVSSIQVLTTNPALESWGFFQEERMRLLELLNTKAPGLMLLSGDVHFAEISNPNIHKSKSNFLEVTSSGLTHTCKTPLYGRFLCQPLLKAFARHRHEPDLFFMQRNFGTLEIDWQLGTMQALIHDAAGHVVMSTGPRPLVQQPLTAEELQHVAPCMDGHLWPKLAKLVALLLLSIALMVVFQRNNKHLVKEKRL